MLNTTLQSRALVAAVMASLLGSACAKTAKPSETAQRVESARGNMKGSDTVMVTVEAIDAADGVVILHDEDGQRFAIEADDVALATLKPKDRIEATYQEAIAFALEDPNAPKPADGTKVEESAQPKGRDGVQFGRRITTTVEILAVAPEGKAVEFRVPEGAVRAISIEDPKNQREVQNLRPGDSVAVTYTEKLVLALHEVAKR